MITYRLTEAQRAVNAEIDSCTNRCIPIHTTEIHPITGDEEDVVVFENQCNLVVQYIKTDKCHRCGKIYTYP